MKIMYNNINGIRTKQKSLERIIEEESPTIIGITETRLGEEDDLALPGYVIKRVDRKSGAGGVLIAYKVCLKNVAVVVREEKGEEEMLWIKFDNGKTRMRVGIVYMPQEKDVKIKDIKEIHKKMEEEIEKSKKNKETLILMGDMNCKVGISNTEITKGGKILLSLCEKLDLALLNNEEMCKGVWTRIDKNGKKSILDYFITDKKDLSKFKEVVIDEMKEITPFWINDKKEVIYTDHCTMMLKVNQPDVKEETANYMDRKGYGRYTEKIQEKKISDIISKDNFVETYSQWSETVMETVSECSSRRKKSRGWKVHRKLQVIKKRIGKELKDQNLTKEEVRILKIRRSLIDEYMEKEHWKKNHQNVCNEITKLKNEGGVDSTAFWDLLTRLKGRAEETANVMENKDGELVEEKEEILAVYEDFYQDLLQTRAGETEIEKEGEAVVEVAMRGMELLAKSQKMLEKEQDKNEEEAVGKIIASLKNKKAKDMSGWKNEYIKEGGIEMEKSILKIASIVDDLQLTPDEWDVLKIKSVHKKGEKTKMKNKRGLFMTNLVSKVYEKMIKVRNKDKATFSENQTGGVEGLGTIDNVMIVLAIIERNTYLGKATMLTFADIEKCFDKIWLDDGLKELWKCGMDVRDVISLKRMNESAKATVETPLGRTREITLKNTVKQGTVNGPPICGASVDTINNGGYNVVTHYGPDLQIQIGAYVDDLESAGSSSTANHTIKNCALMEERKKLTFNTDKGKSGVLVVNGKGIGNGEITAKVKNGTFKYVDEHKLLGTWIDKSGKYMINIKKRKEKLSYMIGSTNRIASTTTMGKLAISARLKMLEIILVVSILYNAEAFSTFTLNEMSTLESVQATLIRGLLEVPSSTPYFPLLLETGMWTMEGRIHYRKLMLYHHIINSPDRRVLKKVILSQMVTRRKGTWYHSLWLILCTYEIEEINVGETKKSAWKKIVKKKIQNKMEKEIRSKCREMKKGRTVAEDKYCRKEYLKETTVEESKQITKMRLHMSKLPCNYGRSGECCWLCEKEDVNTEHYFECPEVGLLKTCWNTTSEDMKSAHTAQLLRASKFLHSVEQKNLPVC